MEAAGRWATRRSPMPARVADPMADRESSGPANRQAIAPSLTARPGLIDAY